VTTIAIFLGVEPNPEDRVSRFEWLDQATFETMNFCKVQAGQLCWIYPGDQLLPHPNVDRTTLLYRASLYWVPGDDKIVQTTPHHPASHSSQEGPSSFYQSPPPDYIDLQDTLRSIQEEQVFIRVFLLPRTPLFGTLSKGGMMSFVGCLVPRHIISRTIGYVYGPSEICISLIANHPILYHHLLSDCSVLLPFPFFYCMLTLRARCDSSMEELVVIFGV